MSLGKHDLDMDQFREAALDCPLPQAVEVIGDKWSFLILRGALNGLAHFEEFQAGLGIARNILSNRLGKLVEAEILERSPHDTDRRKVVYTLTRKGEGLLPVVVALRQWAEEWGSGPATIVLADRETGRPVRRICILSDDGRTLSLSDLVWVDREEERARAGKTAAG